jgi:molecular chaperone GrpE (heat shock protein)
VIGTLANLLQAIGYVRFEVNPGEPFDPSRMQCLGYRQGKTGVVLEVLQPGYAAAGSVVRPAGVLIADPALKAVVDSADADSPRGDNS